MINGNYALEADLTPAEDALALERPRTTRTPTCSSRCRRSRDDPRVKKLAKLLTSPEVKQFIESKYRGAVLPTF